MKKQVIVALCLAWAAVCCLAGTSEAIYFRYENLGTLGGNQIYTSFWGKELGINDAGQVVGKSYTAGGSLHAFVKSPGRAMQDLGLIPGAQESLATCINNSGVIGGYWKDSGGFSHACFWTPSGGAYEFKDLGLGHSQIRGLNDAGNAVGWIQYPAATAHAYLFSLTTPEKDLGTLPGHVSSWATGINSSQTIVGNSYDSGGIPTACVWSPSGGTFTVAPIFGVANSWALAVNHRGQAVGFVTLSPTSWLAALKSPGQALQYLAFPGFDNSYAYDINGSGWVVGEAAYYSGGEAFLWTPSGGMQVLRNLVVNLPPGVWLSYAMAINKRGEIAGYTGNSVYKLTPIVTPPYLLLLD